MPDTEKEHLIRFEYFYLSLFWVRVRGLFLTFACSLLDCQHLHAAHPGLLHGRGGPGTTGETGMKHTHVEESLTAMDYQSAAS